MKNLQFYDINNLIRDQKIEEDALSPQKSSWMILFSTDKRLYLQLLDSTDKKKGCTL